MDLWTTNYLLFGKLDYIFYCCWLGCELAVVYFFYVETRNTPLEEIAKHFDGDDALLGGAAATEKGLSLATDLGLDGTLAHTAAFEDKRRGVEVETIVDERKDA